MEATSRPESISFNRMEWGGAFGDVGTLVPLAIGLVVVNGLNPAAVFLVPGLLYLWGGLYYRIPMAVQPLKAFSAIAIASGWGGGVLSGGALFMGMILLFLGTTGLTDQLARYFTKPIIRGIQVGVGLILVKAGVGLIFHSKVSGLPGTPWLMAVGAALILFFFRKSRRLPAALVLLGMGVLLGFRNDPLPSTWGPAPLQVFWPSPAELWQGLTLLAIPQVPLTIANSVIAPIDVARGYYGDRARRVTFRALATDLGVANTLAGLLGGMPVCHGSGGLTAHYTFGARTGGASIITGAFFLMLALGLGDSTVEVLGLFPLPILGVMLGYVGIAHAWLIQDLKGQTFALAMAMGLIGLLTGNLAYALLVGLGGTYFPKLLGREIPVALQQ
ncbi:MAG: putative sulfate/molybdate transporter [Candidatus Methylomirabilales bacterium]